MKHKFLIIGGTAVISAAAGSAAGFLYAKRLFEERFDDILDKEIAGMQLYYAKLYKKDKFATPATAVQELISDDEDQENRKKLKQLVDDSVYKEELEKVIKDLNYRQESGVFSESEIAPQTEQVVISIWEDTNPGTDMEFEEEVASRDPEKPYIISVDEYSNEEEGFRQISLTYFAGDDILVDDTDRPIQNVVELVSAANLLRFGHLSNDPKIVYVRNEKFQADFEIVKHEGTYAEVVLGEVKTGLPRRR